MPGIYTVEQSISYQWNHDCNNESLVSDFFLSHQAAIAELAIVAHNLTQGEGYEIINLGECEAELTKIQDGEPITTYLRVVNYHLSANLQDFEQALQREKEDEAEMLRVEMEA